MRIDRIQAGLRVSCQNIFNCIDYCDRLFATNFTVRAAKLEMRNGDTALFAPPLQQLAVNQFCTYRVVAPPDMVRIFFQWEVSEAKSFMKIVARNLIELEGCEVFSTASNAERLESWV
jgi:hypothetical protein